MKSIKTILIYALILAGAVVFVIPLVWMLTVSVSEPTQVAQPGLHLIPTQFKWSNYSTALTLMPFGRYAFNTIKVTFLALIGGLLSSALVAFAFARLRAPGKDALFVLMLSTIMLPGLVTMIPLFIIFKTLGWYDTLLPLIVPAWFGNAFYIFLMRQFFMQIPVDLEEAARIDGCGTLRIFWQIIMPLSKPVLVTVAVFSFVAHWNDFMNPLIYLNSVNNRTLALGLATFTDVWGVDIVSLMAASTAVLLPVLIIFFFAQRYFVQGVVMTGIKG
ncbi:MAG: carbohydrate ABC transporter permease [Armatimonadetes bacterium]|nr:carbohydrate ABC transporter permease [Armatimonadota bacterium]